MSEQGELFFGGQHSITEVTGIDLAGLCKISGANDGINLKPDGRIDMWTNNNSDNIFEDFRIEWKKYKNDHNLEIMCMYNIVILQCHTKIILMLMNV